MPQRTGPEPASKQNVLVFDKKCTFDEGHWREYAPGIEVKIRPVPKSLLQKLRDTATVHYGGSSRRRSQKKLDELYLDKLLYRHMVEDWRGVVDTENIPICPIDENIDDICGQLLGFAGWILEESEIIAEEMTIKNSPSSSGGNGLGSSTASDLVSPVV